MIDEMKEERFTPKIMGQELVNKASIDFQIGNSFARFEVQMTSAGLLAVGFLVSSILLSVAPIVNAATRHLRG